MLPALGKSGFGLSSRLPDRRSNYFFAAVCIAGFAISDALGETAGCGVKISAGNCFEVAGSVGYCAKGYLERGFAGGKEDANFNFSAFFAAGTLGDFDGNGAAKNQCSRGCAEFGLVRVAAVAGGFEQEYSEFGSEC